MFIGQVSFIAQHLGAMTKLGYMCTLDKILHLVTSWQS